MSAVVPSPSQGPASPAITAGSPTDPLNELFSTYSLGSPYDEMFDRSGAVAPQCRALVERSARATSLPELRQHQTEADKAFLTQGITFTVYGDDAGHRANLSLRSAAAHHPGGGVARRSSAG